MRKLIICMSLLCLAGIAPAGAQEHDHGKQAATPVAPAASRWQADATLSTHMAEVGSAVEALEHYRNGHMGPEQAVVHATSIEDHVRQIIATCKLPPEQDAKLHTIIVPLLSNAGALKADPSRLELIEPMRKAMEDYRGAFSAAGESASADPH